MPDTKRLPKGFFNGKLENYMRHQLGTITITKETESDEKASHTDEFPWLYAGVFRNRFPV